MIVFIGMETSGMLRRRFQALGRFTVSCDILPPEDGAGYDEGALGGHIQGDVFETLDYLWARNLWPDLGIFHPTCTYLTNAAEWAYGDPDYDRWPGAGYHQKVKDDTLTGEARREARREALQVVRQIMVLPIRRKCIENPKGAISTSIRKPDQKVQPNWFGDDASKGTYLWLDNLPLLTPTMNFAGRLVDDGRPQLGLFGTGVERWANQTDSGQNALSPGPERWKERSRTYPGIAAAMASAWGNLDP